ncbi:2',3'-cyclic-nucleotide 2'-phosphodiesterase/5'-or 3'-nucleotidase, 5'-nucleotidase family [Halomicrobium zhouii]|uniref:2',3'-cyclic-nucleotide 2'-phosphodiesterase/5'-or 3'-nucleotidase, 5'-nucleotidase family n=1 Tax=Halomicrobium zhouii TaxID=767519 RepID=A0A1I6L671_9EURY|nr:5'-nucleotidase C-terminal domain-containing protein [Halomicrobium zhouii]SFR98959.1 2',3'-cyclic-nucleotide 2'-phosphodiesterase/5'-or 3'-nucleotidase, 5'-nucleotidase family [Halomicrobium zhouii]
MTRTGTRSGRRTLVALVAVILVVAATPLGAVSVGAATTQQTAGNAGKNLASAGNTAQDTTIESSASRNATTLTILSYNDVQTAASDPDAMGRFVGTLHERRAAHDNPTVVVGGGDQVSPSSLSPVSQWRVPVRTLNVANPDAEVVGNHDLDYGFEPVENYSEASEFPWLAANVVREDGETIPGTENYTIVERDGVRVGVVGLVDEAIEPKTAVDFEEHGYRVADYSEVGGRIATKLKTEEDVDVVVAAAHIGVPDSKELARETENIDVIVTGDDEIDYPPRETSGTVITEATARGEYVGELNLTVTEDSVRMESGRIVEVTDDASVDETARDVVAEARSDQLSKRVGRTNVPLDSTFSSNYHDETAWGNLVTDAFRNETGAEVAVTNAGGIRGDFVMEPGPVTYDDVYTSLPFGNYLVTKELTGEQLRELLASQVITLDSEEGQQYGAEPSLQVSGVTYEFATREGSGPLVRDVAVDGEPLRENATYAVTVNSYMADWSFEDRYGWSLADRPTVGTDYTLYGTAAANYVNHTSPVERDGEDRIRRVDRELGTGTVVEDAANATNGTVAVRFAVPDAVTNPTESTFRLENETSAVLSAESISLGDGNLTARFDATAFEALRANSDDVQLYGAYDDAEHGDSLVYRDQAVLNGAVPSGEDGDDGGDGTGEDAPDDAAATLEISSVSVSEGETATVAVNASSLPDGLSGGQVAVSVSDPSVATVTDASAGDAFGLTAGPNVTDDGAVVRFADLDGAVQPGATDATLATLTVAGESAGTTNVTVRVDALDGENGTALDVATRNGTVTTGPPPVVSGRSPADHDHDGTFEDLNGNGRLDYDDVVTLFEHIESGVVEDHHSAYDFNGNGRVDYEDVVTLYEAL